MGGCNRCDGGSIRHTAGHGDTRSEKCPWCRIAELEAEVTRWRDRHADAMAKLAQVREWSDDYDKKKPCEVDLRELDAILADSRKPLQLAGTEVGHRSHVLEGGANGD